MMAGIARKLHKALQREPLQTKLKKTRDVIILALSQSPLETFPYTNTCLLYL